MNTLQRTGMILSYLQKTAKYRPDSALAMNMTHSPNVKRRLPYEQNAP